MTGRIASETVGRGSGEDEMTDLGKSVLSAEPGVPAAPSVEWQPIEAAPKDGTPILSWDGNVMAVLVYCGCERQWQLVEDVDYSAHPESPIEWAGATHWMPLPTPPGAPGSPQPDQPTGSRKRAALDIAVEALRQSRHDLIVAITACCELEPEEFNPENANVVHRIDRALDDIAALVPDAVK